MNDGVKGHIRTWPWHLVQQLLRDYGPGIATLAKRGDMLCKKIIAVYKHCHANPHDMRGNAELRDRLDEWMQREMSISDRHDLGSKFGHLVEDDTIEKPIKIFVPETKH